MTKQQLLMLTLDAKKVFYSVLWPFIFEVFRKFKFDETFISWLQMMYKTQKAVIRVNGTLLRSFKLFRGTQQGILFPPLVFISAMEPLAEKNRNNYKIKGI